MGPYYRSLYDSPPSSTNMGVPQSPRLARAQLEGSSLGRKDEAFLAILEKKNKEQLEELDKKIEEAETMEGESEIAEGLRLKAMYLTRIGEKVCVSLFLL